MVFTIHGVKGFSGTQNVLLVLEELKILGHDVRYEVVTVDMASRAHKEPEYLQKMHPFGQTPVFVSTLPTASARLSQTFCSPYFTSQVDEEDGFKLFESRAIARYAASKYDAESLYPRKDLKKAALYEQAQSFELANFHTLCMEISTELIYKP